MYNGDPVIKRGGLWSSYQEGWVVIQLSRGVGCDPVIKRGGLWSSYQEGWVVILLTGLTPPHFCACPKPGHGFPTSYVVVFVVFSNFRWEVIVRREVIVRFVDIGGIDDHHCLNFLFIKLKFCIKIKWLTDCFFWFFNCFWDYFYKTKLKWHIK